MINTIKTYNLKHYIEERIKNFVRTTGSKPKIVVLNQEAIKVLGGDSNLFYTQNGPVIIAEEYETGMVDGEDNFVEPDIYNIKLL